MLKLIICGNGFDLHHGFKTKYIDYKNFLLNKEPRLFKEFEDFFYFKILETDRWTDIEKSLTMDIKRFVHIINKEYYPSSGSKRGLNWYDLDIEIEQQTKFIYDFTGKYFLEWLIENDYSISENKINNIDSEDLFITFNYTDTLREVYKVASENIYHIHGSINSVKQEHIQDWFIPSFKTIEEAEITERFEADEFNNGIIREEIQFGSIYNKPENIKKELNNSFRHDDYYFDTIEPAINRMVDFCEAGTKNIEKNYYSLEKFIRKKQIKQVSIMGHSILGVDKSYYSDVLVPILKNCLWSFYCHNCDSYSEAEEFIREFNINSFEFISWDGKKLSQGCAT
jgi:hypothetical protein